MFNSVTTVYVVTGASTSVGIHECYIVGAFTSAEAAAQERQRQADADQAKADADRAWYQRAAEICGVSGQGGLPRIPPEAGPRPSADYGMEFRVFAVPLNRPGRWDLGEGME